MRRVLLPALAALAMLALPVQALELKPFAASYTADWKQLPISGTAKRSLQAQGDGRWLLSFEASMLVAGISEESTFRVEKGAFVPQTYLFERSGLGRSKKIEQDFDWTAKQVLGSDRGEPLRLPLNRGMLDKSTYQLVLQHDVAAGKKSMSYQVIDGDEVETYDFRVLGDEVVSTKAGLIDAVKVERVRDPTKSSRQTVLWFAKDWNFVLVRLHQVETDGKEYQIMLKDGTADGKTIQGKAQ